MGGAVQRLAELRGRGSGCVEALFLELQPLETALDILDGKEDPLSQAQRAVLLHGSGDHDGAARAMERLGQACGPGIAAVVASLLVTPSQPQPDPVATDPVVPGGPDLCATPLMGWLTRVQGWREVLGV